MIEFYPQIKLAHVSAALASGTLFFLRGLGVLAGARLAAVAPVRYLSYTIDTILLTAALMLMTVLHQYPFVQSWLTVKIALVVLYIVLGSFAITRGRTQRVRLSCWLAALGVYGVIVSIALTHSPWGAFNWIAWHSGG